MVTWTCWPLGTVWAWVCEYPTQCPWPHELAWLRPAPWAGAWWNALAGTGLAWGARKVVEPEKSVVAAISPDSGRPVKEAAVERTRVLVQEEIRGRGCMLRTGWVNVIRDELGVSELRDDVLARRDVAGAEDGLKVPVAADEAEGDLDSVAGGVDHLHVVLAAGGDGDRGADLERTVVVGDGGRRAEAVDALGGVGRAAL